MIEFDVCAPGSGPLTSQSQAVIRSRRYFWIANFLLFIYVCCTMKNKKFYIVNTIHWIYSFLLNKNNQNLKTIINLKNIFSKNLNCVYILFYIIDNYINLFHKHLYLFCLFIQLYQHNVHVLYMNAHLSKC